jgi:hypothetical protein
LKRGLFVILFLDFDGKSEHSQHACPDFVCRLLLPAWEVRDGSLSVLDHVCYFFLKDEFFLASPSLLGL